MSKLKLDDVRILGQGEQIKNEILKRYKSIREFYDSNQIPVAYKTFRSCFFQDIIGSPTFKYTMTRIFDVDYNSLFVSKQEQIKLHVQSIYNNIKKYDEEDDQQTFNYLLEECKKEEMDTETAIMYRAKARNYYNTNWINHCIEYYDYAIEALTWKQANMKIFFFCELTDDLARENMLDKAEKRYKYLGNLVAIHKEKLDNTTLYYYHYWRGVYYMIIDMDDTAREFFQKAVEYAPRSFERAGATANIGYAYKKLQNYDEAIKCYQEALEYPDSTNVLTEASVYNNMAVLYKDIKDYTNAIIYVRKALDISETVNDLGVHLIFVSTQAEIQMEMGDKNAYKIFFDLLLSTKGKEIYSKPYILNGIKAFIRYITDIPCLNELIDIIIELINASNSCGYKDGLEGCIGHITIKIRKLTKGV